MAGRAAQDHLLRDIVLRDIVLGLVVGIVLLSGPPFWFHYIGLGTPTSEGAGPPSAAPTSSSPPPSSVAGVIGFQGGCAPFVVYAQNRWPPYGAAIRTAPSQTAGKIDGRAANEVIAVNGWVHAEVAYSWDPPPFDNDVWFHLADGSGWVSFAGVRGTVTEPDSTLHDQDGGPPAPLDSGCQGTAR